MSANPSDVKHCDIELTRMSEFPIIFISQFRIPGPSLIPLPLDGRFVGLGPLSMIEAEYDLMKTARSHFSGQTGHR
jgi:hypothetical protein